jgi:quinol monooxygenase YgiN
MVFVRMGTFSAKPERSDELLRIYEAEAIPLVRAAAGNVGAFLLRQRDDPNRFTAITVWRAQADAEAYERSGQAARVIDTVRSAFSGPPTLTTCDGVGG